MNSTESQPTHCTKNTAGNGPLVPAGRVTIVRSRAPSGASITP